MSSNRLIPLGILLIVLIVAALILKRPPAPAKLSDEAGLVRLMPSDLQADRITGLDLYQGATPEQVVRLRRRQHTWVVASHYDAPVQADKITSLLKALSTLTGELRSESAELVGDFRLESAQALHVRLYLDNAETPSVHLLAGKGRGRHGFVRHADEHRVYTVNLNLYTEAGLYGRNPDQPPGAKAWIDLQMQNIPAEHITEVALQTPMRRWHFVRRPPHVAAAEPPQKSPKPKSTWALVEPDVDYPIKPGRLEALVTTLRTLRAEDVADPAKRSESGLDTPRYGAILTLQPPDQKAHQVRLWVGREVPGQAGKRYARIGTQGRMYILPQWTFDRLFPKANELLELRILRAQPEEVTRLSWRREGQTRTLQRVSSAPSTPATGAATTNWQWLELPQVTVDVPAVNTLLTTLTRLVADDWLESTAPPADAVQSVLTLAVTQADTRTEQITLSQDDQQYYATVQGTPGLFVIPAATATTLIETLRTLAASDATAAIPAAPTR